LCQLPGCLRESSEGLLVPAHSLGVEEPPEGISDGLGGSHGGTLASNNTRTKSRKMGKHRPLWTCHRTFRLLLVPLFSCSLVSFAFDWPTGRHVCMLHTALLLLLASTAHAQVCGDSVAVNCTNNPQCNWTQTSWTAMCAQHCQACIPQHVQCGGNGPMPLHLSFPPASPSVQNLELDGNLFTRSVHIAVRVP
jgi:hypothetical protein